MIFLPKKNKKTAYLVLKIILKNIINYEFYVNKILKNLTTKKDLF